MLTDDQINKLGDPAERIYQRCNNLLSGLATITVTVRIRGGGSTVRTTEYEVSAISGDVLKEVTVKGIHEYVGPALKTAWTKARRDRDIDVFQREVVQRSGKVITPELAQSWGETLTIAACPSYSVYKTRYASYMSQATTAAKTGQPPVQ
jgi:hypothetical protein